MNIQQLFGEVEAQFDEVVSWRRHLHAHPELSFEEVETGKYIVQKLTDFGYDVQTGVGGNGIIAKLQGAAAGPTIALRADFDALPIQDLKSVSYASKNAGISHSCGHDGHASALLGVAKILAGHQQQLKGTIVFVFQHAEEKPPGGAIAMLAENILADVDFVFGAHLDSSAPVGTISVGPGYQMAAVDYFKIDITGKAGHGARPQETHDALTTAAELVSSLQKIVSRSVDPLQAAVVTIGQFHAGTAFNVIAGTAMIEGTVRTYNEEIRQLIPGKMKQITTGITLAHETEFELEYAFGYPALNNTEAETARVQQGFIKDFGEEAIKPMQPSMGGEDFAYFLLEKPGTYFKVGSWNGQASTNFPHHHGAFDIDEQALTIIQQAFLSIVVEYLL